MSSEGRWSDDAVGRGILGQRGKAVSLLMSFHSFMYAIASLYDVTERESVCFLQRPVLMSPDPHW